MERQDGYSPVSYTHLDVYKRQDVSVTAGDRGLSEKRRKQTVSAGRIPVSYTHLISLKQKILQSSTAHKRVSLT